MVCAAGMILQWRRTRLDTRVAPSRRHQLSLACPNARPREGTYRRPAAGEPGHLGTPASRERGLECEAELEEAVGSRGRTDPERQMCRVFG